MRVAIRTDAAVEIGTGHVMRCLALADALRSKGVDIVFICRKRPGDLCALIESRRFTVCRLPELSDLSAWSDRMDARQTLDILAAAGFAPDWIIADHYRLDAQWENAVRECGARIMVIDDLADRRHECALLLDQNFCHGMNERYRDLVPPTCLQLLGPGYALLRSEFRQARMRLPRRDGALRHLLLFFGGSDPGNETAKALHGVQTWGHRDVTVDVVIGAGNPHRHAIEKLCAAMPNVTLHCQVQDMAALMLRADLALGAGGITTWERCCLALPAMVTVLSDNQAELTAAVADYGPITSLGRAEDVSAQDYCSALQGMSVERLAQMAQRAADLVDGGGCDRVAEAVINFEK